MRTKNVISFMLGAVMLCGCSRIDSVAVTREYNAPDISLNNYKIKDADSLYSIHPLAARNGMHILNSCFFDNDTLLVVYMSDSRDKATLSTMSLKSGIITDMGSFSVADGAEYFYPYIISTSPIIIADEANCRYHIYDETRSAITTYSYNYDDFSSTFYDNEKLYCVSTDNHAIICTDFLNESTVIYDNFCDIDISWIEDVSDDERYLIVYGTDAVSLEYDTYIIDTTAKTIIYRNLDFFPDTLGNNNSYIYRVNYDEGESCINAISTNLSGNNKRLTFPDDSDYVNYYINSNMLYTSTSADKHLYLGKWNMQTCDMLAGTSLDLLNNYGSEYVSAIINDKYYLSPDGNKMIITLNSDVDGIYDLVLWDINETPSSKKLVCEEYTDVYDIQPKAYVDYGQLSERADAIYEKYGLQIILGDNCPFTFPDYTADTVTDYATMENAMNILENALAYYPDGFFNNFTDNYLNGFNIYMSGHFYAANAGSISNAAGFSVVHNNYECIALDITDTYSMPSTIYHEISHAIYDYICHREIFDGREYFDEGKWMLINPENFEYYNSYLDEYGNGYDMMGDVTNTGSDYQNDSTDSIYFVDTYSKTYLTEDLARLMEYDIYYNYYYFMESEHIQEKLKFYYDAIRSVWDSSEWSTDVFYKK